MQISISPPSHWLVCHSQHIKPGGKVLDVAAGAGRNAIWLQQQGFQVEAVDRDAIALQQIKLTTPAVKITEVDLEDGVWPYSSSSFDAIVVCRYLHRPLLPLLIDALADDGVLIYETFMQGHEQYGRPRSSDFLLKSNELLDVFKSKLTIIAYEEGLLQLEPNPAVMQRIIGIKTTAKKIGNNLVSAA